MTLIGWLQIGLLFAVVAALVKPLGLFMARAACRQPRRAVSRATSCSHFRRQGSWKAHSARAAPSARAG